MLPCMGRLTGVGGTAARGSREKRGQGLDGLAGRISQDVVAEVKRSADIVDIVSRYLALKKSGRNFKALCPFHTEKTPSFTVNAERQMFHCFGCGKAGDVFTFVSEHERVEFVEAVRIVADAVGVSIPETWGHGGDGGNKELKTRLYELHRWAKHFFTLQLAEPNGAVARDYLAARHFDNETIETWGLGYAPDSWEALGRAASKAGYSHAELIASGLVIQRDGKSGYYDRFRNRLVFPIADVQGRTIGFGARELGTGEVKYLNSPETPLFNKGRGLYGLDKARDAIIEGRRVMITEGYTDTVMCHKHGITWAVATLGTALTRDHVRLLRRYADQVILVFDADAAGESAVDRSLEVFADEEIDVRVATTEQGSDPCEALVAHGAEPFLARVDQARDLFAVKLYLACAKHDVETANGRAKAIDEVLAVVRLMTNPTRADLLAQAAAKRLGVDIDPVRRRLGALRKPRRRTEQNEARQQQPAPMDRDEGGVLRAVLAKSELVPCVLSRIGLDDFQDERARSIMEQCVELYDREGEIDCSDLTTALHDPELVAIVADMATDPGEGANWEPWVQGCLDNIERRKRRHSLRQLRERVHDAHDLDREALAAIQEHHRRRAGPSRPALDE